ncbi:MAG: CDP-diacylglycerol--glycerol-3-phosphate 3-phosphatidyltransferase [Candidatus Neoclostridium sp.]
MNLPTKITLIRLLLVPVFVALFLVEFPYHYFCAVAVFVIASLTDYFDGHLARKYNLVTDLGKFLDPFADKALVCSALVLVTTFDNAFTVVVLVMTLIIIVRELMITAFRTVAATKNVVLAADIWGKAKTCMQMTGLIVYMLYPACESIEVFPAFIAEIFKYAGLVFLALATVFAIISACNYIIKNKNVFSEENASSIAKKILSASDGTIAVAESFTGGNLSSALVSVPGASKKFVFGGTCYSNQAKENILGVSADTISDQGAVSEQTALEMLDGLKKITGADYLVATTGNAGPTAEKEGETGVCFIGIGSKNGKKVKKYCFRGDRRSVIEKGTIAALKTLLEEIENDKN